MVQYYWNKYRAIKRYSTNPDTWPWEYEGRSNTPYSTDDSPYEHKAQSFSLDDEGKVVPNYNSYHRSNMSPGVPYYFMYNPNASMESGHREYVKFVYSTVGQYYVVYQRWRCKAENIPSSGMARGQLVQSNIVAGASAYVNGGVHSDGFWYERGSALPIAPTTPGTFTQPSGDVEIGDVKVIAWGATSDVNNDFSRYILEVAVNNGSWVQIGTPTTNRFSYTIPTASRIQFRVKAVDARNLESSYRTSSVYTVTKPKYYWNKYKTASGGLVQSGIVAEENKYPTNKKHSDGYWYVRGSRVNQAIAPPGPFTTPTQGKKFKPNETVNVTFGASSAPNLALYEVDYRFNNIEDWTPLPYNTTLTRSFQISTNQTHKTLELRVRAKNTSNVYSDYIHSDVLTIEHNVAPTVSLRSPSGNVRLYENDTLTIEGTAFDPDADQSVTVYYQINEGPRKILATNLSQVRFTLTKQLTFKGGKLYNGKTAITDQLSEGTIQKLFVWAEDTEKGSSPKIERRFSVVPNRAPLLSVNAVVPSGVVDTDSFKISGKASDDDANATVKVTRRINAGEPVEIYSGSGGAWEFDVKLAQLITGENTIVLKVVDNYGAKASKTIKLNKKEVKTPILQSVARYQIEPPNGSAKGVLLFIQRDKELNLKVELSMTAKGEPEQYTELKPVNTAPITAKQGVVEDTFEHKGMEAKQRIVLKITPMRTDLASNHKIYLITGAVD